MFPVESWYEKHSHENPSLGKHIAVLSLTHGRPSVWLERRDDEYFVCAPPDFSLQVEPDEDIRNYGRFPHEIRIQGVFRRVVQL